jgi:hypothetical protein
LFQVGNFEGQASGLALFVLGIEFARDAAILQSMRPHLPFSTREA